MTLLEGRVGQSYQVLSSTETIQIERRLEALGLIQGTVIELLNRKRNGATIFKVRGTRLAVGKEIAAGIEVSEVEVAHE